jgi:hypothetical protein
MAKCPACGEGLTSSQENRLAFFSRVVPHDCGGRIQIKPAISWGLNLSAAFLGVIAAQPLLNFGPLVGSGLALLTILVILFAVMRLAVHYGLISEVDSVNDTAVGYRLVISVLVIIAAAAALFGLAMRSGA